MYLVTVWPVPSTVVVPKAVDVTYIVVASQVPGPVGIVGPPGVAPIDEEEVGWTAPPMDDIGLEVPVAEDPELTPLLP